MNGALLRTKSGARFARLLGLLCGAASLAGCSEYLDRRNAITAHVGDSVRANIATNVIDPWPATAAQREMRLGGRRAMAAMDRYNNPPSLLLGPPPVGAVAPGVVPPVVR